MKAFKTNNEKLILNRFWVYGICLLVVFAVASFLLLYPTTSKEWFWVSIGLCLLASLILGYKLFNLKCIDIENSGEILTIKQYHPLKKSPIMAPVFELPLQQIYHLTIEKRGLYTMMIISIERNKKDVTIKRKFNITGMDISLLSIPITDKKSVRHEIKEIEEVA